MAPGTPAPTFAPLSTVAPAPTALRTAVPTVAPATPAAAAPVVYISIEPNNAIDVQEVARTTSKGAIRLVWSTLGDALAVESRPTVSLFGAGSLSIIRTTTPSPPSKILDFSPDSNTLAATGNQNKWS